jgi:uncharacterized protein
VNKFHKYAYDVLEDTQTPMTYQEIWKKGVELGLDKALDSKGKTPWQSLGARLFIDVRDNPDSPFQKLGKRPARFILKKNSAGVDLGTINKIEKEEYSTVEPEFRFKEREMHPLLSYFVYANPTFNRGRAIYTKTIYHERSRKEGYSEWLHPDMVGFYIPLDDWGAETLELNKITSQNALSLFSFELKKSIGKGNYREAFFQAVSNSSWANEGYLVAAEISDDDELLAELERLSISFGIGIIRLDVADSDASYILFHATPKKELDWETINKLSELNGDFRKFIQDVKIDFEARRIHKAEYDEIIKDLEQYSKRLTDGEAGGSGSRALAGKAD